VEKAEKEESILYWQLISIAIFVVTSENATAEPQDRGVTEVAQN